MAFRVLVVGDPLVEYAHLRDTLDRALASRLPAVELVTAGGPGLPALVASYAATRSLPVAAVTLNSAKHRGNAEARRDDDLVALADAAVVVEDSTHRLARLVTLLRAKGVRVVVVGPKRPAAPGALEAGGPPRVLRGMPPD